MLSQEIRRQFLNYFKSQGHTLVPSSPVVPHDDPTLLFVNAGMNQFKDVFLGKSQRDYTKAASSQKCIRVGGKHNDLENVGHTTRHLTFFEMLGNFSFGDYFKKEAIDFGFEVTTIIFGLDPAQIYATVFYEDEEAFELWKKYLPEERIIRMGEKDNFWAMGDMGPCGPSSELLFDRGPKFGHARNPAEDIEGERFFEFWNLVFMQYNRILGGELEPLPKKSVDTGAGLERIALLKTGVHSLFETDILRSLIASVENLFGIAYDPKSKEKSAAFHVIADHLRSLSFAIADGVQPSNIERGYVLRKVLRRAVRYGRTLGMEKPFLAKILPRLVSLMGEDYPELVSAQGRIAEIVTLEEENFLKTLQRGGTILNQIVVSSKEHGNQISGDDAFKLKDTYGLPLEEILLLAKDVALTVDIYRFEELEKEAKIRSRSIRKTTQEPVEELYTKIVAKYGPTPFLGYNELLCEASVLAIIKQEKECDALYEGEEGGVLLNATPFYSEKGGQVGDRGTLSSEKGLFSVFDCKTPSLSLIFHYGVMKKGELHVGDRLTATVDPECRQKIANNHTATHLLHWALHEVLGGHIRQAGSIVEATRIRFDFSHHKQLSNNELIKIEDLVNEKIRENKVVHVYEMPYAEAVSQKEIKQFFGDKYGSVVRVIDIDYSKELCGGTHTQATGHIGYFKITRESSIASGIRRIEATTGRESELYARSFEEILTTISACLKVQEGQVIEKVHSLLEEREKQLFEIKKMKKEIFSIECKALFEHIEEQNGISLLIREVPLAAKELKELADMIFEKHTSPLQAERKPSLALFLITQGGTLWARLSQDLIQKGLRADLWLKDVAQTSGGKGGGNAEVAQGTLPPGQQISKVLDDARVWIQKHPF